MLLASMQMQVCDVQGVLKFLVSLEDELLQAEDRHLADKRDQVGASVGDRDVTEVNVDHGRILSVYGVLE